MCDAQVRANQTSLFCSHGEYENSAFIKASSKRWIASGLRTDFVCEFSCNLQVATGWRTETCSGICLCGQANVEALPACDQSTSVRKKLVRRVAVQKLQIRILWCPHEPTEGEGEDQEWVIMKAWVACQHRGVLTCFLRRR